MRTIARVMDKHICPLHGTNVIIEGSGNLIDGRGIARVGDACACGGRIIDGDVRTTVDGRAVAYFGSKTTCGGVIAECKGSAHLV